MSNTEKRLLRKYRNSHDCAYCLYYRTDKCDSNFRCYLEEEQTMQHVVLEAYRIKKGCLAKDGKSCPYGNDVGTCFGYCWKEILNEFKEKKRQEEQTYE
ncbi:MAG: hypothetical protein J6A25_03250 [Lachnospiraceae bacterium]|nr:hypothetical protein [Lachnospiraceae bacterium]